jgi:hypothetical protein
MGIGYINHGARETAGRSVGLLRPTAGAASPDPTGRRSLASRVNSRLLSHAPHVVVVGRWERAAAGPRRRARDAAHQQTTHLRRGAGPGGKTVTAPRATPATWEGADVRDHVVASVRCHSLTGFGVRSVYSTVPCPTHTFLISLLMSPGQKKKRVLKDARCRASPPHRDCPVASCQPDPGICTVLRILVQHAAKQLITVVWALVKS